MFIEKIKSPGLSHLSWLFGAGGRAAVVDPRRDCDVYLELAAFHGAKIELIFETHRNEDLVSGAPLLSKRTGAKVLHGPNPAEPIRYAETARDGDSFRIASIEIRVLETPGHTEDSLSFVAIDHETGDAPVCVFTGDALFVGDVGRTDFYPDRMREMAGTLYESLRKLVGLGDGTTVLPAHGAGSVCGSGMADREMSTIGHERLCNPRLQIDSKDEFIEAKVAELHVMPPYFEEMERLNVVGASPMRRPLLPPALDVESFERAANDAVVVDVRPTESFLGAHVPGSLGLAAPLLSGYAGWLLAYDEDIVLVAESHERAEAAAEELGRIGFDRVVGWLEPSLAGWASAGCHFETLTAIDAAELDRRLRARESGWQLLDVRSPEEVAGGMLPGAKHLYVGELPQHSGELDPERRHTVVCGSGARATLGASILRRHGIRDVDLFLGAMRHLDAPAG